MPTPGDRRPRDASDDSEKTLSSNGPGDGGLGAPGPDMGSLGDGWEDSWPGDPDFWRKTAVARNSPSHRVRLPVRRALVDLRRRPGRHPRRRIPRGVLAILGLFLLAAAGFLADAYYQSARVYDDLEVVLPSLRKATNYLAKGQLPPGDPFRKADDAVGRAAHRVDHARFTFRVVGLIPGFGRPVHAARHGVSAAGEVTSAALITRRAVSDLLGEAARRPGSVRATDTPLYGGGAVNVKLLRGLTPRLEQVIRHLQAASREIESIRSIPLFLRVKGVKQQASAEAARAIRIARRIQVGSGVLGSFLGADERKTYLIALQNQTDLRGTGGAPLAYAIVTAEHGRFDLVTGGSVLDLRLPRDPRSPWAPRLKIDVPMPPAVSWYIDHVPRAYPWLATANFSPDFPAVAVTWARMVEKATGARIDGVIAMDQIAVARALGPRKIRVQGYPRPITGANLVRVVTHDQYFLPASEQRAFPGRLVAAAWPKLLDPISLHSSLRTFGQSLAQKRIQLWLARPDLQNGVRQLGWDGGLRVRPGDYLYVVDNKIIVNKIDYYSRAAIDYDVTIDPSGNARATLQVRLANESPAGLSRYISPRRGAGYAVNRALLLAFVPKQAELVSATPELGLPDHLEGGAMVFGRTVVVPPGTSTVMRLVYTLKGVVISRGSSSIYRLSIQNQPRLNPAELRVTVRLPQGTTVRVAPRGWTISGNVLTLETRLSRDLVQEIAF